MMPGITFLLGGVRAGKSAKAVDLARESAGGRGVLFVATAQALDDEMHRRIDAHRRERPADWETLESPIELAADLEARVNTGPPVGAVIVDCLTLWVSNLLLANESRRDVESLIDAQVRELVRVLSGAGLPPPDGLGAHVIVVSNEVGLGVVPPTPLGRVYRDALGRANQRMAAAAGDVRLMVAGVELALKPAKPAHTSPSDAHGATGSAPARGDAAG